MYIFIFILKLWGEYKIYFAFQGSNSLKMLKITEFKFMCLYLFCFYTSKVLIIIVKIMTDKISKTFIFAYLIANILIQTHYSYSKVFICFILHKIIFKIFRRK